MANKEHVGDAASVLEEFVQDVANLPAEIAHLLEEIEAKDRVVQECRHVINTRDMSIQKHLKLNGAGTPNPKEENYVKTILSNFDHTQRLQEEKLSLSDKAGTLLDRQIRKLDKQIQELQRNGGMPPDALLPTLLRSTVSSRMPPLSASTTGASTPLHPIQGNAVGPSTTIANSALARLVQPHSATTLRHPSPNIHHVQHPQSATIPSSGSMLQQQRGRESSLDPKRRRLNNIPTPSSNLRQSSLGPGTPKPRTPSGVRSGSAGPGARGTIARKPVSKKVAPHQRVGHLNPQTKKASSLSGSSRRRGLKKGSKQSPSTTGDDSALSEVDASESETPHSAPLPSTHHPHGHHPHNPPHTATHLSTSFPPNSQGGSGGGGGGSRSHSQSHSNRNRSNGVDGEMGNDADGAGDEDGDVDMEDEEDGNDNDDKKYCTCRSVSYGPMVACDNDECAYEWFHWSCVGMTREPAGKWYCAECRVKLGIKP